MSSGTRPPSFSLSWRALFSLPMRICNPPPAASRVRSCKVTPLVKVTLDDVLNKRHLPPLTLKDFEEWLVFVEGNPQYLYFILWLKEYKLRYGAWLSESGCALPVDSPAISTISLHDDADPRDKDLSYVNLIPSSPPLALFFTRAKQTFLDPASSSPYALSHAALAALAPSTHSLAPSIPQFTVSQEFGGTGYTIGSLPPSLATQPHPHPKELAPLEVYARDVLKECLQRFAETACHNVGTRRAWCGVAGGTFITLVLGILPALTALFFSSSRWWRIVGWFGCWLGGTIVVSSFHGICMMIYIFGDLRQLRSFELARPSISGPRAIARARPKLKSFFTREGNDNITGNAGTGSATGTPAQPTAPSSTDNNPKPALCVALENKGTKVAKRVRPWSAGSTSQTSTGTPVVHFGPCAFRLDVGTGTMESDTSATTETGGAGIVVGEVDGGGGQLNDDDFGIEISPAYYYSGRGPAPGMVERQERRESVRSVGSGSRIGLVMRWMLGRRGSSRTGTRTGSGTGGRVGSMVSEKHAQRQSHTRSHSGTFGIRSWRGGLGSLPENPDGISGRDLESAVATTRTTENEKVLSDSGDANLEQEDTLTAEFITRDYPEPAASCSTASCASYEPVNTPKPEAENGTTPVAKKRESSFVSPVKFDFDKLPTAAVSRRMSSPCTFTSPPPPPLPVTDHAATPPQPLLLHPPPALYAHPGARPTPIPPLTIVIPSPKPIPVSRDRQWWDTCPRHPAVEATLSPQARTASPAVQPHNHANPTSFAAHSGSDTMFPPAVPTSSTRRTSLASSDVHSRVRVNAHHVLSRSSHTDTSAVTSKTGLSLGLSSRSSETTWRTRFRRVTGVPAFGPLTRVLEPVVSRGQWEIVIRSACSAALGAWIVIGCLVALPEMR